MKNGPRISESKFKFSLQSAMIELDSVSSLNSSENLSTQENEKHLQLPYFLRIKEVKTNCPSARQVYCC